MCDDRISNIKKSIGAHPNFPIEGITFRDLFKAVRDPVCFKQMTDVFTEHIKLTSPDVDTIVGLESRGFIIGPIVAQNLGVGFVPVRKAGKLPGETYQVEYTLEYGKDRFELQKEAIKPGQNVVIIDDLMATGGTLRAACQLMTKADAKVLQCVVLIQLPDLKGRDNVPCEIKSFIDF